MPEDDPMVEAAEIEEMAAQVRQAAKDRARAEGSHCDDVEVIIKALETGRMYVGDNERRALATIAEGRDAVTRLERHLDASAKLAIEQAREIDRMKAEITVSRVAC